MNLDSSPSQRHIDDNIESVAEEILEAMECLLYLMGTEAASPDLVKAYVIGAKKALLALRIQLDQADRTQRPYLLM